MAIRKIKEWPVYQFHPTHGLFAFVGKNEMYRVLNVGSNSGSAGITIDHYITRRMVIKHLMDVNFDISRDQFREIYNRLFTRTLIMMTEI